MFVLAARCGSLSAAARYAGLTTASVSRQISALEAQLKVRLFNRGARALTLTEAGQILLRRARPLLDELDEAIDDVSLLQAKPRGLLRVSARAVAAGWLIQALPRFLSDNPEVHVQLLVSNDESADLVADNIDVDIRYSRPDRHDLVARLLAQSGLVVVASPAFCAAHGTPLEVQDLTRFEAVLYEPVDGETVWRFADRDGRLSELTPQGRLRVNDGILLRRAILAGIGLGIMPLREVDHELASGELVRLLPDQRVILPEVGGEGIFAVYQRARFQTGKVRSFLAFLTSLFAEGAPRGTSAEL